MHLWKQYAAIPAGPVGTHSEPVSTPSQSGCPLAEQSTVQRPPAGPPRPSLSSVERRHVRPAAQSAFVTQLAPTTNNGAGKAASAEAARPSTAAARAFGGNTAASGTFGGPASANGPMPASAATAGFPTHTAAHTEQMTRARDDRVFRGQAPIPDRP